MTLQFTGATEPWLMPWGLDFSNPSTTFTSGTMDALGEKIAIIGEICFAAGPGTAKTLNTTGGSAIEFRTGNITWATAGSTFRLGIQDVSPTVGPPAVPDEVWTGEPYAEWVQGTDALTDDTWTSCPIESGSRLLTHGDLVAVVWDFTVVNGTDAVLVSGITTSEASNRPVMMQKVGAGPAWASITTSMPNVIIKCNDGTLCTIKGALPCSGLSNRDFGLDTGTADEYGNIIIPESTFGIDELWNFVDPNEEFEMKLYSGSAAAPVDEQEVLIDPQQVRASAIDYIRKSCGQETLTAGSTYATTARPTTTTTIRMFEITVANAAHFAFWPGGTGVYKCTRLNDAGALTVDTAARMLCGVGINKRDDGVGGGGLLRHPGMTGGING